MSNSCPYAPDPREDGWYDAFQRKVAASRTPVSGMIEITRACGLRCAHCYLGRDHAASAGELAESEWLRILDEVAEAGCLYLAFTGGDPLMRRDFPAIYAHARRLGMVVAVFSGGFHLPPDMKPVFREFPPRVVEITLYGARAETHDRVTTVKGSFRRTCENIEQLLEQGTRVAVKTIVMRPNADEVGDIQKLAEAWGIGFRLDPVVFQGENGGVALDTLRLAPRRAVEIELMDADRRQQWADYASSRLETPETDRLYTCGGGTTGFFIDAEGYLSPCVMAVKYRYSLKDRSFNSVWSEDVPEMTRVVCGSGYPCRACEMRAVCTGCGAMNYLESGSETEICKYVCDMAKERWCMLGYTLPLKEQG